MELEITPEPSDAERAAIAAALAAVATGGRAIEPPDPLTTGCDE